MQKNGLIFSVKRLPSDNRKTFDKFIYEKSSPAVSIIVPVFNTEEHICRCLNSIKSQTYNNFEVIIVDDGSSDNSGAICDKYATKEHRFKVIHKKNGGVSSARQWGGYSSSIEALFYGCPIVVAPYNDFVEEFGKEICFGHYLDDNNLTNCIKKILDSSKDDYYNMCKCAYNSVANYTWDNYIDGFIESLKEGHIINE